MSPKVSRWIFYLGTLTSLALFLALTVDTHREIRTLTHADRLSDEVVAGKRVWHRYNCNDCHTILGFGSYYAPDMTKAYWRLGADGIKAAIRNPEAFTTWRKMPRLPLSDQELENLVAFLQWTSMIDTQGWPPQDQRLKAASAQAAAVGVSPGAMLFRAKGCFACHRLEGSGGRLGPDLTHVGSRVSYEVIEKVLTDPRLVEPRAIMPLPDLSHAERVELTAFLARMK